mmetsp:Transcript_19306/g.38968  ORF Transcript_19306/g.38968 Transcript_19306/m.38968 type:complete len:223 (+) Transcript_19306:253-921(+)
MVLPRRKEIIVLGVPGVAFVVVEIVVGDDDLNRPVPRNLFTGRRHYILHPVPVKFSYGRIAFTCICGLLLLLIAQTGARRASERQRSGREVQQVSEEARKRANTQNPAARGAATDLAARRRKYLQCILRERRPRAGPAIASSRPLISCVRLLLVASLMNCRTNELQPVTTSNHGRRRPSGCCCRIQDPPNPFGLWSQHRCWEDGSNSWSRPISPCSSSSNSK